MTPPRPPHRFRRALRYTGLTLAALLVLAAGAVTRVAGFSLESLEQVGGDFIQEFSSEALPTLLARTADARLDTPVVAYRDPSAEAPAAKGKPFAFRRNRPTLVVLLHGATRTPAPGLNVGTLGGARAYWGYRFVEQLLGGQPRTLSGETLSADTWQRRATDDDNLGDHIVRRAGAGQPARFVALLHRDGSDYLGPQTEAAVTQLDKIYRYLAAELGEAPQVVLLAHSMGGLVSRYLLSDPPATQPEFALSAAARQKAAALRDRTLYLITLSTPHAGSRAADDVLVLEQVTRLTNRVLEQYGLDRTRDPQNASMAFLRAFQPSTQHLRSDTLRELNSTDRGLLAPQWARRSDGSLVPIYTLSGRSPGGGFLGNPNSPLSLEIALLQLEGERLGLGDKLVSDTLSMAVSDYLLYNFPGLQGGWGRVPEGLGQLDRVSRAPLFGNFDLETKASGPLELESFPVYYQHEAWRAVKAEGSLAERAEAWVDDLLDAFDPPDLTPTLAKLPKGAPISLIRRTYLADDSPEAIPEAAETSDGRIDGDGVVSLDSGLGMFLGTEAPDFFSHVERWQVGGQRERGSWYRIAGAPYADTQGRFPWDWGNHSFMQYSSGVSGWLEANILERAGPFVGPEPISRWQDAP